jgi:serine/threonine-protein kinase
MNLRPNQDLLHYRLTAKIGEGGMGVVWQARDTTLDRDVAIKILPEGIAAEPERLARFEREAKLLATLDHPNIANVYGLHESDGHRFIAMEYVPGEDLAQRLSTNPIAQEDALDIARQTAAALEAAHDQGVIHRDLKPANIKITPDGKVKVLDLGLAKALISETSGDVASVSMSPTVTSAGTVAGTLLGTAAYMAPEQAKGKPVDRRADIWAFGVVLHEMLTGEKIFEAETISETLAAVLRDEVSFDGLPARIPAPVISLLKRCLDRNPQTRLRDIGEARILLEKAVQTPGAETPLETAAPARSSGWLAHLPWAVAAVAVAVAIWFGLSSSSGPERTKVMRFDLSIPDPVEFDPFALVPLAVSPDGNHVVLAGQSEAGGGLHLRALDRDEATLLDGTESAASPVFSPDGQWIAFAQDGKLRKISVSGGPPVTLCDIPDLRGMSWGTGGRIVFAPGRATGLMLVEESGGTPVPLTALEQVETSGVTPSHRWPEFLPDGKTVLFTRTPDDNDYDIADIVAVSVADGTEKVLVEGATFPKYAAAGFLVFLRQGTLFAARFAPERVELLGPPVPVLEGVGFRPTYGNGQFALSETGLLTYLPDLESGSVERLVWLDREGQKTPASAHERSFEMVAVSPDRRRAVLQIRQDRKEDRKSNLWMLEFSRDSLTRFTFDDLIDRNPVWSPDGEWIAFSSFREGASSNLFRKRSNGTGEAERLTRSPHHQDPYSWSPDGKTLAFMQASPGSATGSYDILLLRFDPEPQEPEVFLGTPFNEEFPQISTDGAWIAYASDETGQPEIYVRPLSGDGGQVKVSVDSGSWPMWSPDGTELIYLDDAGKLMAVRFSTADGEFMPELAREMLDYPRTYALEFDVAGPPLRILTDEALISEDAFSPPPKVVVGWFEELERKVPAR